MRAGTTGGILLIISSTRKISQTGHSWTATGRQHPGGERSTRASCFQKCSEGAGAAQPTMLFHPTTEVRVVVHGNNCTFAGAEGRNDEIESTMREVKEGARYARQRTRRPAMIGDTGKTLRWTSDGCEAQARREMLTGVGARIRVDRGSSSQGRRSIL